MTETGFLTIIKGYASKKIHGLYFFSVLIFFCFMCFLAQIVFPNGYSPLKDMISAQGNSTTNPQGYLIFDIGTAITGLLLIPHILYIGNHLVPNNKILRIILSLIGSIGCIGFTMVGIIRENFQPWHDHSTLTAFGGYALFGLLILSLLICKVVRKEKWPKFRHIFIFLPNIVLLIALIMFFTGAVNQLGYVNPDLLNRPIWEWSSLVNVALFLINMYLIIPNKID